MTINSQTGKYDTSDRERVREAVDLVALISEFVPLHQKGSDWVGICPFHDDHSPSLRVVTYKEQPFYKCFACGASGDCFKFVTEYLKIGFADALRFLAERNGIELTGRVNEDEPSLRSKMSSAMKWASEVYVKALDETSEGKKARQQLYARGFSDATIEQFQIGVSPDSWSFLTEMLQDNAERIETGLEAGLLKKNQEKNRVYDAFRNRLMFPIQNETGGTIAFGGRRLREEDEPKYINSPESVLFHKSKILYGYNHARTMIREKKKAIVVEGYTDVIACHQAGITNVVATLGTALTAEHADKLSRMCNEVVLVFDGDDAGQLAADRAVEVFFKTNVDVLICVLPEGKDPADLVHDVAHFNDCIEDATDALSFKWDRLQSQLEHETTIAGKKTIIDSYLNEMARLGIEQLENTKKTFVYERLASLLSISMSEVVDELRSRRPVVSKVQNTKLPSEVNVPTVSISKARQIAEREFLAVLLFAPTESSAIFREEETGIQVESFVDAIASKIATYVLPRLLAGTLFSMPELIDELDEESENIATSLYFVGQRICETYENVMYALNMTLDAFKNAIEKEAIEEAVKGVRRATNSEEKARAAEEAIESIRRQQATRNAS